ncbi:SMC family ATPase [Candidatus Marsarchaeota archaeon]|nr:SMC family ATPase [Candidatus Marsarchaeota archaeon]
MITHIRLTNWKTHKDTSIDFQSGTNVIVGMMGAGKSSMMDAIAFALFGTFPALEHKRYKLEDIIMSRPEVKHSASVELTMKIGEDVYRITRTINKSKKADAKIEKNGKYLQTQPERVNEEIESILKIDYDVFSRAVYSEQNRLDYFLELRKGERKKQIDNMLGLDRFAAAEENATSLANYLKTLLKEDERLVESSNLPELEKSKAELMKELEASAAKKSEYEKAAAAAKKDLASLKLQYEELKAENERKKSISEDIARIESRIKTLGDQLAKIEKPQGKKEELKAIEDGLAAELEKARQGLKKMQKKEKELIKNRSYAESALGRSQEMVGEAKRIAAELGDETMGSIKGSIDRANEELKKAISALESSKSALVEIRKVTDELEEHSDKCPVCEQVITPELRERLLKERRELMASKSRSIAGAEELIRNREQEISALNKRMERFVKLTAKMEQYKNAEEESKKLSKELERYAAEYTAVEKALAELKAGSDKISKAFEEAKRKSEALDKISSIESEIAASESALKTRRADLGSIKVDMKQIESVTEALSAKNSEFAKFSAELKAEEELSGKIRKQLEENKSAIERVKAVMERAGQHRRHISNISKFKDALADTETRLRSSLVSTINSMLDELWPGLYPYGDYTGIMLNTYNDDYSLEAGMGIEGNTVWLPVDAVASGGERSIACLALRIAMSMVIAPNLKWLILDEPTHNLDVNGISKMVDVFGNFLPNYVDQIFIITHDDTLKQISGAKVYEFTRDKAVAGPTNANDG